jgi:pimeloyl-ACP methyl ester carboxylesterase
MIQSLQKPFVYLTVFALLAWLAMVPPWQAQAAETPARGPAGEWLGTLEVGAVKLRLGLHLEAKEGGLVAVVDSLDQGAKVPVATATFEGGTLTLGLPAIGATYQGTLNAGADALEGTWSQGGRSLPLTFRRQAAAVELHRPQLPQPPFPYASREVTFRSGAGNVLLAGTVLLPQGKGPFPAVVLLTGSGAQNRDEALMGHKPFLVIADALARRGIASLRWDDRGVGGSEGSTFGSTVGDLAADARAALTFLRSQGEVDAKAVGILGHSEGGLIAPIVAAQDATSHDRKDRGAAFLVLLAPPGEPLLSLLRRQTEDLYRLQGVDGPLRDRALAAQAEDLELAADPSVPSDRLLETLRARAASRRKLFSDEERARLGIDSAAIEQAILALTSPWLRSLVRQIPADSLRSVKVPVLALFGGKDFQVAPQINAEAVRQALVAAGNRDHEERIFPGLNHLFQHADTGGMDEYGTIEETLSPEVLQAIGDWIAARFGKASRPPGVG